MCVSAPAIDLNIIMALRSGFRGVTEVGKTISDHGRIQTHLELPHTSSNPFTLIDSVINSRKYSGAQLHITARYSQQRRSGGSKKTASPTPPKIEDISNVVYDVAVHMDDPIDINSDYANNFCTGFDVCYQPCYNYNLDTGEYIGPTFGSTAERRPLSPEEHIQQPEDAKENTDPYDINKYVARLTDKQREYYYKYVAVRDAAHAKDISSAEQKSQKWLTEKLWRDGASEAGGLLGLSDWKNPTQAVTNKIHRFCHPNEVQAPSKIRDRGTYNEDQAVAAIMVEISNQLRRQIEQNLERCFRHCKLKRKDDPNDIGRARRRLLSVDKIPDYHKMIRDARANLMNTPEAEVLDSEHYTKVTSESRAPQVVETDDERNPPSMDETEDGEIDDFLIEKKNSLIEDSKATPTINFFGFVHLIPNNIIHKWYNGDPILQSDILSNDPTGRGALPKLDCPIVCASPDMKILLWGVIKLFMGEVKWPGNNSPYVLSKSEHYAQCQQTLWIHEYPLMLYSSWSTLKYTITPFYYDHNYIRLFLVPTIVRITFCDIYPQMVEHCEKTKNMLHGDGKKTGGLFEGSADPIPIKRSKPADVLDPPPSFITNEGWLTTPQLLKCVGEKWSWSNACEVEDLEDD